MRADELGEAKDLAAANRDKAGELRAICDAMMEKAVPSGEPAGAGSGRKKKRK